MKSQGIPYTGDPVKNKGILKLSSLPSEEIKIVMYYFVCVCCTIISKTGGGGGGLHERLNPLLS